MLVEVSMTTLPVVELAQECPQDHERLILRHAFDSQLAAYCRTCHRWFPLHPESA